MPAIITAVQRRELARMFERAKQLALAQPPDFRGAHQVLSECCTLDPGNTLFVQALLENLYRALLKTAKAWPWQVWSLQSEFEKAVRERRYVEALAKGWALLGERPTLLSCLIKLAEVCDALDHLQTQLLLLETAHHLQPANAAVAELFAKALASAGQFDQADKLRREALTGVDVAIPPQREVSITDIELAVSESRWNEAFDMLVDLHGAEGANLRLRELGEEIELGKARQKTRLAEEQAAREPIPRHKQLANEVLAEQWRIELGVAFARYERYSSDPTSSWELAQCLSRIGNFSEARRYLAPLYQRPDWQVRALIATGENWQQLRQFDQALDCYRQAIDAAEKGPAHEFGLKAWYRGAVLAEAMGQRSDATVWLARLTAADPHYKDAAERLVKLRGVCDKGGFAAQPAGKPST